MGPVKWSCFYLYVILDIFSRRVVGWRVEHAQSAAQFKELFTDAIEKHAVPPDQMTHAARQTTLDAAFLSTPERFVRQPPKSPQVPTAVWINPPNNKEVIQA